MGKLNFLWDFTPLSLIISPARREQVKIKVVFDYVDPSLQHSGNSFLCVGVEAGAFLTKLFLAELNWTVLCNIRQSMFVKHVLPLWASFMEATK